MKIPALVIALALGCGTSAFAAESHHDAPSGHSAQTSMHQLATDFKGAMHKLGQATRHALRRADESLHRPGHDDRHT